MDGCFFCWARAYHTTCENHYKQFWPTGYKPHGIDTGRKANSRTYREGRIKATYRDFRRAGLTPQQSISKTATKYHRPLLYIEAICLRPHRKRIQTPTTTGDTVNSS